MKVVVRHEPLYQHETEALILFLTDLDDPSIVQVNGLLEGAISQQVAAEVFSPQLGQVMVLPTFGRMAAVHVVVLGWGTVPPTPQDAETAIVVAIRKAYDWAADDMAVVLPPLLALPAAVKLIQAAAHQARQFVQTMTILATSPQQQQAIDAALKS